MTHRSAHAMLLPQGDHTESPLLLLPAMPPPRPLVITQRLAVARNPKSEPEFFPTMIAVHAAAGLASGGIPGMAEQALALAEEALRKMDPETGRYVVTRIESHTVLDRTNPCQGRTPIIEKHGWRIFIDWE